MAKQLGKKMTTRELREAFLSYFESKQHRRVPSSSLVPMLAPGKTDETILFTNAGMNQFKRTFLGEEKRDYKRATTVQKCVRAGGKHNDLENVGFTKRHHTFFEMLGNFSFGDYFKEDAIKFAWEFLTKTIGLPKERLWVTIFENDDEAGNLWKKHTDVMPGRILKMGEADNFWRMGDTGPCGPCTEIHIDLSVDRDPMTGKGPGSEDDVNERYIELWNLVFMQFNQKPDGTLDKLPKPSVDTGAGLERIAAVLQGVNGNYETDALMAIIRDAEKITGVSLGTSPDLDGSLRVLADHIRASTFLIADGVLPSREGRGYVLRRIMRRAIRHGKKLGVDKPFFYQLVSAVVREMGDVYPEIAEKESYIKESIKTEEDLFLRTLTQGLELLQGQIAILDTYQDKTKAKHLDGAFAFKLYDTYGFPLDLTLTLGREMGFTVDEAGFEKEMEAQRERSRDSAKHVSAAADEVYMKFAGKKTEFLGYGESEADAKVVGIILHGKPVDEAGKGAEIEFVVDRTVLYGESGGQVGDTGFARNDTVHIRIDDVQKPVENVFVHRGHVEKGTLKVGDKVRLHIDQVRRQRIRRNHSATHLMHAALRRTLGTHVAQAGSQVGPDKLRFDFNHMKRLEATELSTIEALVNEEIRRNETVETKITSPEEATKAGAMALFGEKYGDEVRVIRMGDFSMELCGGTHVSRTGDIGLFKIVREEAVAGGVRRVTAVTGDAALAEFARAERTLDELAGKLNITPADVPARVEKMADRIKELEREVDKLKRKLVSGDGAQDIGSLIDKTGPVAKIVHRLEGADVGALREFADRAREKLGSGVVVVISDNEGKVAILVAATADLKSSVNAGAIVKEIAPLVGGKGGGKPDMAQAGGTDPAGIPAALEKARQLLSK